MCTPIYAILKYLSCISACLWGFSILSNAQVVIYRDPTHKAGEQEYIKTTKELIKRINNSSIATAGLYTASAEEMRQLEKLKNQQYTALTSAYAFYTDSLRIRRFNESLSMIKSNLEKGLVIIESNPRASYFFKEKIIDLIASLNDAETIFKQATVVMGKANQMSNADRNILLFKSEDMLADIAKQGQGLVNIGKMITLDPERMEQLIKDKYNKSSGGPK